MGCCFSDNNEESTETSPLHDKGPHRGVGMGIAMMMQQAGAILAANASFDMNAIEAQVRKAKAEGKTVTLINGCLYFDYQLVAQIPPSYDLHI
uniref:Ragulator complex protein LAMTOR5 n=1 Tax=Parastrongyloides trichosuri TaxID=131310 RepID=A0A0N4ZKL4_PARTI